MKQFVNKPTEITMQDGEAVVKMNFADLALRTLEIPPQGGWTNKEMRTRFKLEDKLKGHEVDKVIDLEDADVEKLHQLANIPWQFKHRDVLAYMDHLDSLVKES